MKRNLNKEEASECTPGKQYHQAADSREPFSLPSLTAEGVFYRSCNFCGGKQFRVFKRIDIPFPERIYGDRKLTYPDGGKASKASVS